MKKTFVLMLIVLLLLVGCGKEKQKAAEVDVDLYLMSFCPFGNQAEEIIEPVYDALKDEINFNAHYVIYSNYRGGGPVFCLDEESKYCSMHGVYELNQGIRELCVANHIGYDEWFDFIKVINKQCNYVNVENCWEEIAQDLGLDTALIKKCEKEEGLELSKKELALSELYGIRGSPTLLINNEPYNGPRDPQSYLNGICKNFEKEPAGCSKVLMNPQVTPTGACN